MNIGKIRWGSYKNYEGPWAPGEVPYELPDDPSEEEQVVAVITATEGGKYDAVNMYDVCLWTAGIIQWCNRAPQRSVDSLLTAIFKVAPDALEPLGLLAAERGYELRGGTFYKNGNPVITVEEQKKLYFLGSNGVKNGWAEEDKVWARHWCLATQQVLAAPETHRAHRQFTLDRVLTFAHKAGKELLDDAPKSPTGLAWRALYLSFAANNPAQAAAAVEAAVKDSAGRMAPWTEPWLANMARHLTFDSGISIYPHRYNQIRPVIERLWGVDLPDTSAELPEWQKKLKYAERWGDPVEVQRALIALGFDLGPRGADGIWGRKSRSALLHLELGSPRVPKAHQDGMPDQHTLPLLEQILEEHGITNLS